MKKFILVDKEGNIRKFKFKAGDMQILFDSEKEAKSWNEMSPFVSKDYIIKEVLLEVK